MKSAIETQHAPQAIGPYSQAVRVGQTVYLSGQIGLDPATMQLPEEIDQQIRRVLMNLQAVAEAAGGCLDDIVRLTVYLSDLKEFSKVNEMMAEFFSQPYPARSTVGVAALPRNALVEMDAVLVTALPSEG